MADRLYVDSLLTAVGLRTNSSSSLANEETAAAVSVPVQPGSSWHPLIGSLAKMRAEMKGDLLSLAFPPYIVRLTITDGHRRYWQIAADGTTWRVSKTTRRPRGRPRRSPQEAREIRDVYEKIYPEVKQLRQSLNEHHKALSPTRRRRWQTVRRTTESFISASQPSPLIDWLKASTRDEDAVLTWKGEPTEIGWNDYLAGCFPPRPLALAVVGEMFGRRGSTIECERNLVGN